MSEYKSIVNNNRYYSLYVTAGEKCKTIGAQDGTFPDFGHHMKNEMGGIWIHPIKIADGFYLGIDNKFYKAVEYETLPYGSLFRYEPVNGIAIQRFQFSPDEAKGVYVRYTFKNNDDNPKSLKVCFITRFDIMPVWLSENAGIFDFEDNAVYDGENQIVIAKDSGHDWYGVLGSDFEISSSQVEISKEHIEPYRSSGKGVSASISLELTLEPKGNKELTFIIAGSPYGKEDALKEFRALKENRDEYYFNKLIRYHNIRNAARLETSDQEFDHIFEWVKYNIDWLIQDCEGYGRGLTAGMPEYPWWFGCDNSYSTQGLLALGSFDLAKQTLLLLKNYSEKHNGNGRIVHEVTTNGVIANPGNSQETSHFIMAVYNYLRWTGDIETTKELYDYCKKGISWLLNEMDEDRDLLPSGYGIIEIQGLNVELIDTAVYTCKALYCMHEMSRVFGEESIEYLKLGEKLKEIINTRLWDDKYGLFVDAVGTTAQVIERIDALLNDEHHKTYISPEYRDYLSELKQHCQAMPRDEELPFIINKNWVINTPMETHLADHDKALTALDNMKSDEFVGEYGIYLSGFMKQSMMTISTGVQAVAEARNGRCGESLALLKRICKTYGLVLPGSISEMSPDYGCFVQAWTVYGMAVSVVECFAGFKPQAYDKKLVIEPCIPYEWDKMNLQHIRIGDSFVDFSFTRNGKNEVYVISSTGNIDIQFNVNEADRILVNGEEACCEIHLGLGTSVIEVLRN
ncbi:MAG TPA: glycogen debranching protein [Clostridiales bacterium]|nr:glycogen debranching protein [Clostridiales bacterium]